MTNLVSLKECDRIEGSSKFTPWRYKLHMFINEMDLLSICFHHSLVVVSIQEESF
jgi:hypothetical protein